MKTMLKIGLIPKVPNPTIMIAKCYTCSAIYSGTREDFSTYNPDGTIFDDSCCVYCKKDHQLWPVNIESEAGIALKLESLQ